MVVGFNDEITALKYIPSPAERAENGNTDMETEDDEDNAKQGTRLLMATNSEQIRVVDMETSNTELLIGHKSVVFGVDVSQCGRYAASVSKDMSVRLWSLEEKYNFNNLNCIAVGFGHTESVTSVKFFNNPALHANQICLVTTGSDKTVKFWSISKTAVDKALRTRASEDVASLHQPLRIDVKHTFVPHDKVVNDIDISPNGAMLATASQDKTIKVFVFFFFFFVAAATFLTEHPNLIKYSFFISTSCGTPALMISRY